MSDIPKVVWLGDCYEITVEASADLSGATSVEWKARREFSPTWQTLESTVDGATVTHILDGTLIAGTWNMKIVTTWPAVGDAEPEVITFPTDQNGGPQTIPLHVEDGSA